MNYKRKLKGILKDSGKTGKVLSGEIGMSYSNFRKGTSEASVGEFNWVRAFVIGYEMGVSKKKSTTASGE